MKVPRRSDSLIKTEKPRKVVDSQQRLELRNRAMFWGAFGVFAVFLFSLAPFWTFWEPAFALFGLPIWLWLAFWGSFGFYLDLRHDRHAGIGERQVGIAFLVAGVSIFSLCAVGISNLSAVHADSDHRMQPALVAAGYSLESVTGTPSCLNAIGTNPSVFMSYLHKGNTNILVYQGPQSTNYYQVNGNSECVTTQIDGFTPYP